MTPSAHDPKAHLIRDRLGTEVRVRRAVQVDNLVVVAGTTAVDEHGKIVGPGHPGRQAKFIYGKIARALAEAGASLADVVRVRTFVVDIDRWEEVAEVQGRVFGTVRPAATLVEVSALVSPELLVEIEVDAIIRPSKPLLEWANGRRVRSRLAFTTSSGRCAWPSSTMDVTRTM